jgi:hypothetical protein
MLSSVLLRPALLCVLTVFAFPAAAQSFYKCKMPNGQVRYSDQLSKDKHCQPIAVRTFAPNTNTNTTSTVTPSSTDNSASVSTRSTQMAPNTATQVAKTAPQPAVQSTPKLATPVYSNTVNRATSNEGSLVPSLSPSVLK